MGHKGRGRGRIKKREGKRWGERDTREWKGRKRDKGELQRVREWKRERKNQEKRKERGGERDIQGNGRVG